MELNAQKLCLLCTAVNVLFHLSITVAKSVPFHFLS